MARNSIIMICKNIKLDKNYQNVLTYTEQQMYNLCYANKIDYANDFQFIKEEDNSIIVPFTYENCMKSNYMAFQNPRYSNKWFFAFVESVNYVSDKATRINFTIDVFATWFDYWSPKSCFVEREHVMNDTIGLHTIPEQLETGDYIQQNIGPFGGADLWYTYLSDFQYVVALTEWPFDTTVLPTKYYNGIYSGLRYVAFNNAVYLGNFLQDIQSETTGDPVYSIFVVPQFITGLDSEDFDYLVSGHTSWKAAWVPESLHSKSVSDDYRIADAHILDQDYVPINNKLLVYPYRYILVNNNAGSSAEYRYEWFYNRTTINNYETCHFTIKGTIGPGCNIKLYPTGYGKYNIGTYTENLLYSLDGGKLPTCAWVNDPYINWLTQNAINTPLQFLGNVGKIASGLTGNFSGTVSGITGIIGQVGEIYTHSLEPNTAKGGVNQGDINCSDNRCFNIYRMSIKKEFAEVIDNFMTRFGYQVNIVKIPNQTGRRYFNYVKIGTSEIIGYPNDKGCPADAMEEINRMYRSGITLWHDHSRIGNYNDNTINT